MEPRALGVVAELGELVGDQLREEPRQHLVRVRVGVRVRARARARARARFREPRQHGAARRVVRCWGDELDEEVGLGPPEDVVRLVPQHERRVRRHHARQHPRLRRRRRRLRPRFGARPLAHQPKVGGDERVGRGEAQRGVGRVGGPAREGGGLDGRAAVGGAVPRLALRRHPGAAAGGVRDAAGLTCGAAGLRREAVQHGLDGGGVVLLVQVARREHLLRRQQLQRLGVAARRVLRLVDVLEAEAHLADGRALVEYPPR
eukprot:scaffold56836_cov41-Phaeocystis_antarctica.AAC.1